MRRAPLIAILAIGVGLIAAPAVFGMFTRAPAGGQMLDAFEPFMHAEVIDGFGTYLSQVDAAAAELAAEPAAAELPQVATLLERWPGIHADMTGMLDTIAANFPSYDAVAALPPFALFPWFFVVPGVGLALLAWRGLAAARTDRPAPAVRVGLALLGVGLFAAPLAFQMYSRAPLGEQMIEDFSVLMTPERVTEVQHHFLTMASGEGAIRNQLLPAVGAALPETAAFVDVWPQMSREMAPMMGTMSDQLDAFAGIAALPPFSLFPWFFALPGLLVLGLALAAGGPLAARRAAVGVAALALLAACGGVDPGPPEPADEDRAAGPLEGLLRLTGGECPDGGVTAGSYFRMVQSGGTVDEGPYVENGDSPCADQTWTPLRPGGDGGLRVGVHQPLPEPAFDEQGNALASAITEPTGFFAVAFGVATNPVDPQTGLEAPPPTLTADADGRLSGDLSAWAASWNAEHFNQGAPKPGGWLEGNTTPVAGAYDRTTGALTVTWTSQIAGGPFNNFTGLWHLEGTLEPAG